MPAVTEKKSSQNCITLQHHLRKEAIDGIDNWSEKGSPCKKSCGSSSITLRGSYERCYKKLKRGKKRVP